MSGSPSWQAWLHEWGLSLGLVGFALFAGVIVSDLSIYGLGRFGRKHNWLKSFLEKRHKIRRAANWLDQHMLEMCIISHLVPGVLFPTFLAYGLYRISLKRFFLTILAVDMIYVTGALYLFLGLGLNPFDRSNVGTYVALLAALVVLMTLGRIALIKMPFFKDEEAAYILRKQELFRHSARF